MLLAGDGAINRERNALTADSCAAATPNAEAAVDGGRCGDVETPAADDDARLRDGIGAAREVRSGVAENEVGWTRKSQFAR